MFLSSVIVAQLGARMHYAVPQILYKSNLLTHFYTDICAVKGWPRFLSLIPPKMRSPAIKRLLGRVPVDVPLEFITAFTNFGYEYYQRRRKVHTAEDMMAVYLWAGEYFNQLIYQNGFRDASYIYGFNSASETLFRFAKKQGLKTILEQTIAPKAIELAILNEEKSNVIFNKKQIDYSYANKIIEREYQEWQLADVIVCPSEFVRQHTIAAGASENKCIVVPYGINLSNFIVDSPKIYSFLSENLLRVLFVGTVGFRKGVNYLIDAMRQLEGFPIQCRIVGPIDANFEITLKNIPPNIKFIGSIPRSEIIREYTQADVFCLPSLCEGSATVIYEALAASLPIVTTYNSGSLVRNGIDGFIIPIRDSYAIATALKCFLDNPILLEKMGSEAQKRSQYGSIEAYSMRLVEIFSSS